MKSYQTIPIVDCGEPLQPIPADVFVIPAVHPYAAVGAPYGGRSPYSLRQGVLERLHQAQNWLQRQQPGWRLLIFDAYRPIAVQRYMVDYAFGELVRSHHLNPQELTDTQRHILLKQVYRFWAVPSLDPATPPPHSTGAAIDVTLTDADGVAIDLGSPIDELSRRSYPNYFAAMADPQAAHYDPMAATYHQCRQLLRKAMLQADFCPHVNEWWHFSYGDQMWVWQRQQAQILDVQVACYGAVE